MLQLSYTKKFVRWTYCVSLIILIMKRQKLIFYSNTWMFFKQLVKDAYMLDDLQLKLPHGFPSILSFKSSNDLWNSFFCQKGLIEYFDRKTKGVKISRYVLTSQEKIYVKSLLRGDRENFNRYCGLSNPYIRFVLRKNLTEESNSILSLEHFFINHVKNFFGIEESELLPVCDDSLSQLSSEMPWFSIVDILVKLHKVDSTDEFPLWQWILPIFNRACSEDIETKKNIAIGVFAIASWYHSLIPILALIERHPEYSEFFNGLSSESDSLFVFQSDEATSLFSPDMFRICEKMKIQSSLKTWMDELQSIDNIELGTLLSKFQEFGSKSEVLSKKLIEIEKTIIAKSIEKLIRTHNNIYSKVIYLIPDYESKEKNTNLFSQKWESLSALCLNSEEQSVLIAKLNETTDLIEHFQGGINSIKNKVDRLKADANLAVSDSLNPFDNIEKLNLLYRQHREQIDILKDTWKLVLDAMIPNDDFVSAFGQAAYSSNSIKSTAPLPTIEEQLAKEKQRLELELHRNMELEDEVSSLKIQCHQFDLKIKAMHNQTNKLKDSVYNQSNVQISDNERAALISVLTNIQFATPIDVLTSLRILYPDRVKILANAWTSAKESHQFKNTERLFLLLKTLVNEYLDAINNGQPDSTARQLFGKAYAAHESETVMKSQSLRNKRLFLVDDTDVLMEQHLNIGVSSSLKETIRVHFKVIDGIVVIGHCGEHLPLQNVS